MDRKATKLVRFFFYSALLACLAAFAVQPAFANLQSFIGDSFDITPGTSDSTQIAPSVAYNSNLDQWLVVWKDYRSGTGVGIFGRRVDIEGNLLDPSITVLDNSENLHEPSVAFDNTQSRYLVVWENNTNGNIEGRVLNANGSYFSDMFTVADCVDCNAPDVVYSPVWDEYLVVWEKSISLTNSDIRGRLVGVDGTPDPGGDFPISTAINRIEQNPAVVCDPNDGSYLVVYSHNRYGDFDIGAQRLFHTGAKIGGWLSISNDIGDENYPDVALNPADEFAFITWHYDVAAGTTEVEGRLLQANNSLGSQSTLSASGGSDEMYPSITSAPSCDPYLVTWQNDWDVFGRWLTADGDIASDIFTITGLNTQYSPAVAFGHDRYLVTFNNWDGQYDIYGRFGTANPQIFLPTILN
jgi:hypothetical protein